MATTRLCVTGLQRQSSRCGLCDDAVGVFFFCRCNKRSRGARRLGIGRDKKWSARSQGWFLLTEKCNGGLIRKTHRPFFFFYFFFLKLHPKWLKNLFVPIRDEYTSALNPPLYMQMNPDTSAREALAPCCGCFLTPQKAAKARNRILIN